MEPALRKRTVWAEISFLEDPLPRTVTDSPAEELEIRTLRPDFSKSFWLDVMTDTPTEPAAEALPVRGSATNSAKIEVNKTLAIPLMTRPVTSAEVPIFPASLFSRLANHPFPGGL